MREVNKILVPIDFSDASASALRHALSLAMETKAEVMALHVIEKNNDRDLFMASVAMLEGSPFPVNEFPTVPLDVLLRERTLDLWNFIGRTIEANKQIKITKRVRMGSLLKTMTATIHEENIDLVVIAPRQRMSFPDLGVLKLIKMIRRLPCPVLLDAPTGHDRHEPRKPLFWLQPTPTETPA
jgi:nucleotide-binding universal stress UspA family protein